MELIFIHHKTQHGKCVWFRYCIQTPQLFLLLQSTSTDLRLKISWNWDTHLSLLRYGYNACVCCTDLRLLYGVWHHSGGGGGVTPDQRAGVCVPSSRIIHTIIITTHRPNTPDIVSGTCRQSVAVTSAFVFWGQYGKSEKVIQLCFTKLYGS